MKKIFIKQAIITPLFILSVILMVLNDHIFKGSGILPTFLTGKLSDIGFLFFSPILIAFLCRIKTKRGMLLSYSVLGLAFTGINVSPWISDQVVNIVGLVGIDWMLWPDITDLSTLSVLPFSYIYFMNWIKEERVCGFISLVPVFKYAFVLLSLTTCVFTSEPTKNLGCVPIAISNKDITIENVNANTVSLEWEKAYKLCTYKQYGSKERKREEKYIDYALLLSQSEDDLQIDSLYMQSVISSCDDGSIALYNDINRIVLTNLPVGVSYISIVAFDEDCNYALYNIAEYTVE